MAKLSARGRTEVLRMAKTTLLNVTSEYDSSWKRITFALMSDVHLLWKGDTSNYKGQWHDRGKTQNTGRAWDKEWLVPHLEAKGYLVVSRETKKVVD